MKNVEEAAKAAKERTLHLNNLKEKKNCWVRVHWATEPLL
jgi:hypothetical protein